MADAEQQNSRPPFKGMLPVGQLNFPTWEDYERSFRDIFTRQYYTNHGPLARQFEDRLAATLQVKHAVCMTNATLGLSMVAEALGIKGKVIVPSFTFIASSQAMVWSNLQPIFCDIVPGSCHLDPEKVEDALKQGANAILGVNLWGGACDVAALEQLATTYGVPLFFDSAQAFGCVLNGRPVGGFGQAEVFSFHATKVMSSMEGGVVTTNDDRLAEHMRNIRSSYGVRRTQSVVRTANGRMSEAQAAVGLLTLDKVADYYARNKALHDIYCAGLGAIPGVVINKPERVEFSNHQYFNCEIEAEKFGVHRDVLQKTLQAEGINCRRYFYPGNHRCLPFNTAQQPPLPVTEWLCERVLQLPLGARVSAEAAAYICRRIEQIHAAAIATG